MDEHLIQSKRLYDEAVAKYNPYATVVLFSGGDDSLTAMYVAKKLAFKVDYVVHVNTRTGIKETTEFVRQTAKNYGVPYLELDAGTKYEDYVLRKGFFGRGNHAHNFSYHILKHQQIVSGISHNIRHGRRGRKVLLLTGARGDESKNRAKKLVNPIRQEGPNIWVSHINHWTKANCLDFLEVEAIPRNPVSQILHRSGECMCGTMQSFEQRREASFWFPEWGKWLDGLEQKVIANGFDWKWGEAFPKANQEKKNGQLEFPGFQPLCQGCIFRDSEGI